MIVVNSDSANLGDNLMLTPLLNHTPCKLRLHDTEWMRFTAPIFDGLCEIEWVARDQLGASNYVSIPRPWSKRLLVSHGFNDVSAIPRIKLTEKELEDGQRVAAHISSSFGEKPLCVIKAASGRSAERTVPEAVIKRIVDANPDIQFITFNLGDNHPKREMRSPTIPGVFELANLPIRAEASVYAAVGRYVGADTGCYHLMLAVGGKADVLCPAHSETYNHWLSHYMADCWGGEEPRVAYQPFDQPLTEGVTGVRL